MHVANVLRSIDRGIDGRCLETWNRVRQALWLDVHVGQICCLRAVANHACEAFSAFMVLHHYKPTLIEDDTEPYIPRFLTILRIAVFKF